MKVTRTIRIQLKPTPQRVGILLHQTMQEYTDSFNAVCQLADEQHISNGVELHRLTYAEQRASTHLPSQLICAARVKATEAIKSVIARRAKQIVTSCQPGDTLVMENLTDIRERTKGRRKQRRAMSNWSFAQLQGFLAYKAAYRSINIAFVNARYSSQACSCCGYIDKRNRVCQSEFSCKHCGFKLNADLNAARNLASRAMSATGGYTVKVPIVSTLRS